MRPQRAGGVFEQLRVELLPAEPGAFVFADDRELAELKSALRAVLGIAAQRSRSATAAARTARHRDDPAGQRLARTAESLRPFTLSRRNPHPPYLKPLVRKQKR